MSCHMGSTLTTTGTDGSTDVFGAEVCGGDASTVDTAIVPAEDADEVDSPDLREFLERIIHDMMKEVARVMREEGRTPEIKPEELSEQAVDFVRRYRRLAQIRKQDARLQAESRELEEQLQKDIRKLPMFQKAA